MTLNVNANVIDEEWTSFSFEGKNFDYKNVFRSNDTYGYRLTLEVNLTKLENGTFKIQYQNGDTIISKDYTSVGNYSFEIATLSMSIALEGTNASASGFYKLNIGERISLSPYGDINLLLLLSFIALILLSGIGIPPILSVLIIIVLVLGLFGLFIYLSYKGIKSWKREKNSKYLYFMITKIAIFCLISLILLFPFRFSFF